MDLRSLSTRIGLNIMRDSGSHSHWDSPHTPNSNEMQNSAQARIRGPGICVPHTLSDTEHQDIQRCFRRANEKVEGYLDCSELKVYMDLRRCPITQWEAEKLLEYADKTYQYYITLEQITNLAVNFGIGTQHPLRLTRSEFEIAIDRSFRVSSTTSEFCSTSRPPSTEEFDFDGVVNYFESRAGIEEMDDPELEDSHNHYLNSEDVSPPRNPRNVRVQDIRNNSSRREMGMQTDYSPLQLINYAFPTKMTPESEDDEIYVDDEPLEPVRTIKEKWEKRIRELIANNADDFLVKLDTQRKLANIIKANSKAVHPRTAVTNVKYFQNAPKSPIKVSKLTQMPSSLLVRPPPTPVIKSIFKRENVHKTDKNSINHRVTQEGIQTRIRGQLEGMEIIRKGKTQANGLRPSLPPPMLPEIPVEFRNERVGRGR